jgi:hypothetical protein
MRVATLALSALAACGYQPLDETDEIFDDGSPRRVFCAAGLDTVSGNDDDSVMGGLERAAERDEVILLYGHTPGRTVPVDRIEAVLARAGELGLEHVTMRELASPRPRRAGLSLQFDDDDIDQWFDIRELLAAHGARVTFFVTRYDQFDRRGRERLRALADDGHDVEAHGVDHLVAPDYVEEHGLAAYLDDEAVPSIERLRADGYDPVAYAYPFGARTSEIDEALLEHVQVLRSVTFTYDAPIISDPCPE